MKAFRYLKSAVLVLGTLAAVSVYAADEVTLNPSDDTYTTPDGGNYGSETVLRVANNPVSGNTQRTNIRFELDEYMGETLASAVVHLYRFFSCPGGGVTMVDFYHITEPWSEDTWSGSHVQHGTTVWLEQGFSIAGGSQSWEEIDLTDLFNAWLSGEIPHNYGFVMNAQEGSKSSRFYSKEYSESFRPYVVLTFSGASVVETSFSEIKHLYR